jgi:hypothetical protein
MPLLRNCRLSPCFLSVHYNIPTSALHPSPFDKTKPKTKQVQTGTEPRKKEQAEISLCLPAGYTAGM